MLPRDDGSLRVMAIARYCRSLTAKNPPVIGTDNLSRNEAAAIATYENYCKNNRRNFALEGFALVTTSVILSGLVIGFGLWPQFRARLGFASLKDSVLLLVVGISGLLFSLLFFTLFKGKVYWLDHSEPKTKMSNRGMKRLFFKAGLLLFLNLLGIVEFSEKRLEALVPRGPEPASDDETQPLAPPPQTSASGTEQPPTAVYEGSEGPKLRTLKPQPGSASGAGDFVVKGENDSGVIAEELKVQHDDSS